MEIIGLLFAAFIGITLGMMGSGGSILTVPVLVYIFHVDASLATTYSLFAIGLSSLVGSVNCFYKGTIDFRKVIDFGLPSVVSVFLTRQFILPLIPETFYIANWSIHQNIVLMILFAFTMLYSAIYMIRKQPYQIRADEKKYTRLETVLQGLGIGGVTGVMGAGGGFLIIPALINFYKMPMNRAVSTSLTIICLNSLFGLIGDTEKFALFDWQKILGYTFFLILGMFLGFYLSRFFKGAQLKTALGYLILVISIFILIKEIFLN